MPFGGLLIGGAALGLGGGLLSSMGPDYSSMQLPYERRMELAPEGELEQRGRELTGSQLTELQRLFGLGPGAQDVSAALSGARGLASMLGGFAQEGFLPTESDISRTRGFAEQIYAPQQQELAEVFRQQGIQAGRQAALQGRSVSDPILRAKMAAEQGRQQSLLSAQRGAYGAQLALQQPFQRLQAAEAQQNVLGGLASQAMQNRLRLLSLGSNLQQAERGFRERTATQSGFGSQMISQPSWGQIVGGGLTGALGGAGAAFGAGGALGGLPQMSGTTPPANQYTMHLN